MINASFKRNPNPNPNPNLNPQPTPNQTSYHYPHSNSLLSEISSEEQIIVAGANVGSPFIYVGKIIYIHGIKLISIPDGPIKTEQSTQSIFQDFALINSCLFQLAG